MTDFDVRPITEDERRPTLDVLGRALLGGGTNDEYWEKVADSWPAEHKFGAFDGGVPIGIVSSYDTEIAVPGGNRVPVAAIEGVGVRADRTRRGVLTAMKRTQLDYLSGRGFPLACLHASEPTIYGRFGYGVGALGKTVSIARPAARLHDALLPSGEVRLLTAEEAVKQIPALYQRIGLHRPGMIGRPEQWWPITHNRHVRAGHLVAVHSGPDGDDGFASYETVDQNTLQDPYKGAALKVRELHAANDTARIELWRYLLSVDLVSTVHAPIKFVGVGEKPEDFEAFHPDRMASRILGLGDVLTLIEKVESQVDASSARRLADRSSAGEFTLEDLRDQLASVKKMGPLSSLLELLPKGGAFRGLSDPGAVDEGSLVRVTAIIDSMTRDERRYPQILNGSRKKRIAVGSGTSVMEINRLVKQYQQMRKLMKAAGKGVRNLDLSRLPLPAPK